MMSQQRPVPGRLPQISVVVPSLNQGQFLGQALDSVLHQRGPCIELIVMDGGSSDGSVELLQQYGDRLAHWESAPDDGPAHALVRGFALSRGDILAVLNADDFYLPGALQRVAAAFARHPDADVISGHGYLTATDGRLGPPIHSDRWHLRRFARGSCVLVQPATFVRRAAYHCAGGFAVTDSLCWDMALWADLALTGARFELVDEFLAGFRLHPTSISGRSDLRRRRRSDSHRVMALVLGRPAQPTDPVIRGAYRLNKFLRHPVRTLRQRAYAFSTLRRWSL